MRSRLLWHGSFVRVCVTMTIGCFPYGLNTGLLALAGVFAC